MLKISKKEKIKLNKHLYQKLLNKCQRLTFTLSEETCELILVWEIFNWKFSAKKLQNIIKVNLRSFDLIFTCSFVNKNKSQTDWLICLFGIKSLQFLFYRNLFLWLYFETLKLMSKIWEVLCLKEDSYLRHITFLMKLIYCHQ